MAVTAKRLRCVAEVEFGDLTLSQLAADISTQILDDDLKTNFGRAFPLATGTADEEFDFNWIAGQDGRFLYIESDQDISVKLYLNTNVAIPITPPTLNPSGQIVDPNIKKVGIFMLKTKDLDKIFLTNASGNEANVTIIAVSGQA